jgi:hypothetical protein
MQFSIQARCTPGFDQECACAHIRVSLDLNVLALVARLREESALSWNSEVCKRYACSYQWGRFLMWFGGF